jgi:hypothetical protein
VARVPASARKTLPSNRFRATLMDHDSAHDRVRTVRIGTLQEQPVIMADKPGVQRLHSPKVGHLNGWLGQFRSPRSMVPATWIDWYGNKAARLLGGICPARRHGGVPVDVVHSDHHGPTLATGAAHDPSSSWIKCCCPRSLAWRPLVEPKPQPLPLRRNSHLVSTHRYQSTTPSYVVAQALSMRRIGMAAAVRIA